eukprot:IDg6375t1
MQVSAKAAGVHAIEPRYDLLRNHSISDTNGVADVEPEFLFSISVANFGATSYRVKKCDDRIPFCGRLYVASNEYDRCSSTPF